jgi:hypothetical protein
MHVLTEQEVKVELVKIVFGIALVFLIINLLFVGSSQSNQDSTRTLLSPQTASLGTFAFYYPWYGTPNVSGGWNHWNEDNSTPGKILHDPNKTLTDGRRDLAAEDYPSLGPYDSNNETVIKQHIEWAREAGISCFIVSWWGQGSFEDRALFNISRVCENEGFNFTVYIENTSSYNQKPPSINQTIDDLSYLLNKYSNSGSWYRIDGRPVIFVYSQARDNLSPQAWVWHACTDSNGTDLNPNAIESASLQWLAAEEFREPPRLGIIPFQPFQTTPGYVETANSTYLPPNEQYTLNVSISDIRNDSGTNSTVGIKIKIGTDPSCNNTLYSKTLLFSDGWQNKSFDITAYAGQNVYLRAESYAVGWTSEWAAVDYFYITDSSGKMVSADPFFDNGWSEVVRQKRQDGANPYIFMDFGGFKDKIDGFLDYYQDCIDGIHVYNPIDFNESFSQVLGTYNIASESAHSRNMSFLATVVPGFDNTAVQKNPHVTDRNDGSYYTMYWQVAEASHPDGYAITSFNEWHESTVIEPSIEYGTQYLNLTRIETVPEAIPLPTLFDLAHAYGSKLFDPLWNHAADLNRDGKVSLTDLVILALHYRQHYP